VLVLGSSFAGVLAEPIPATTTTTIAGSLEVATTTSSGPVSTIKPGEITDFVGVEAGKAPEGVVCQ
jgi:hypothetical protein